MLMQKTTCDLAGDDDDQNRLAYQRALHALPAHIVVVDRSGLITLVNHAWSSFVSDNGGKITSVSVGSNYLDFCRGPEAEPALAGLCAVLDGSRQSFTMDYPCHSPTERRWFRMTVVPIDPGSRSGALISHENITLQKQAEAASQASKDRLNALFENAAVGMAEVAIDGTWLRVNTPLARITGYSKDALLAKTFHEITHPEDRDADAPHLEIMRTGATDSYSLEKRYLRQDQSIVWVNVTLSCVRDADGVIDHLIAVVEDISKRKSAEDRQQMLMRELAHRGMNLLAVVQSIAGRSLTGDRSLAEAKSVFIGRLQALSQTFSTLTTEAFEGAPLEAMVNRELASFAGRARLEGPNVMLTPKIAQTFALVVHELATNAAKYGSLSVPDGEVHVKWVITGGDVSGQRDTANMPAQRFKLEWRESGGPPATPPKRRGFGTTLVSQVAGTEFDCTPELTYGADGFGYKLDAPMQRLGALIAASPVRRKIKSETICTLYDLWTRQRGSFAALPKLSDFDWAHFSASGALTIASIDAVNGLRFVQIGRALVERIGRPLQNQDGDAESVVSLEKIYQRCALSGEPCHELLRFDFGDGDPMSFERLLVPFSSAGGRVATHVIGLSVFKGETHPPQKER
jgi:PAS domain S-box-containing protein